MPLILTVTVGGNEVDYTRYLDFPSIKITERVNIPAQMSFTLRPIDGKFTVPRQRSYVRLYSSKYEQPLFTGFVSTEPTRHYLALDSPAKQPGGQLFQFDVLATSDEHLLNIKSVPFIPAYVNRTQGQILSDLAEILCPGFFNTSMVASGDLVPYFKYDPQHSWCEVAKIFGDASRYRYKVRDKKIWYQPYGDQPLGIAYDERKGQGTFNPKDLNTTILSVPIVNDVTIIGDVEAGNNHEDYFLGDGFTGNFTLHHKVFRGSSTQLLNETWQGQNFNSQQWYMLEGNPGVFDFSAGALNVITNPSAPFALGYSYLAMNNGIELAGGVDLEHGEFTFNDHSEGVIGGVYTDTVYNAASLLGGFYISSPNPITLSASGAAGVVIQPMWEGVPVGPPITTEHNHTYVLQTVITAPKYARYKRTYRSLDGPIFGGDHEDVTGSVTFCIQSYNIAAASGFYYTPDIQQASVNNVKLPSFVSYAVVNNMALNLTNTFTTIATMPMGALSALVGPSGLYSPTGLILPMLPADSGNYIGGVQPWPSSQSGNIIPLPGLLDAGPTGSASPSGVVQLVLGNGLSLQTAQVSQGNESDVLAFYAQTLPAAGTPIRFQSWEAQAAVSRLQDKQSIADEAFVVGDDGVRSSIVSDLNPLPRTSEDCDNAALAYLTDRVGNFYNGSYRCTGLFFEGLTSDPQFWPTVGRYLNVNAPRRGVDDQKYLVVGVDVSILDGKTDLLQYQISFGADLHLEKVLKNFVDVASTSILTPQDTTKPPDPRYTYEAQTSYLPDLNNVQVDMRSIKAESFVVRNFDDYQGAIEVRSADKNWGKGKTADYITTVAGAVFTLSRLRIDQTWYLRPVVAGKTSRRSKVIRVFYPVIPSSPKLIGLTPTKAPDPNLPGQTVDSATLQFDFDGDMRSIYGFELRTADDQVILVQKPAASYADLFVDLAATPFLSLSAANAQNYDLFAYFFNQQWEYSFPLQVGEALLTGTRTPYAWQPGYAIPISGDVVFKAGGIGLSHQFDGEGGVMVALQGYAPVSDVADYLGSPKITASASPSGNILPGTYVVALSAFDAPVSNNYFNTLLSNAATVNLAVTGGINVNVQWPAGSHGGELFVGSDLSTLKKETTLADGQTTVSLGALAGNSYGPPDPLFDHFGVQFKTEIHGGVWADTVTAVSASGLTFGIKTHAIDQFAGYTITLLAHVDQTKPLEIANFRILHNDDSTFYVGPNDAGEQPQDLTTFISPGDVLMVRMRPQNITPSGFSDPNLINLYAPSGLNVGVEKGNLAWVIAGPGAGQVRPIQDNDATGFTLANNWTTLPTADSIIIIVAADWQPEIQTQQYRMKNNKNVAVVATPDVSVLQGFTNIVQVLTEDRNRARGSDTLAPIREFYVFRIPSQLTVQVSY